MKTSTPKPSAPHWVLIDAAGQSLGRISALCAHHLRGKHLPTFTPHQVCGDHVVIINASKLAFRGSKLRNKVYVKHTGYLGHLRSKTLENMMEQQPTKVIEIAVKGMLPSNRLRPDILKRLHVFSDEQHDHEAQQPVPLSLPTH